MHENQMTLRWKTRVRQCAKGPKARARWHTPGRMFEQLWKYFIFVFPCHRIVIYVHLLPNMLEDTTSIHIPHFKFSCMCFHFTKTWTIRLEMPLHIFVKCCNMYFFKSYCFTRRGSESIVWAATSSTSICVGPNKPHNIPEPTYHSNQFKNISKLGLSRPARLPVEYIRMVGPGTPA